MAADAIIANLGKKTVLDLRGLGLKEVPLAIRDLKHIKELRFSENSLTTIPDWIVEFPELRLLALDGNSISGLPCLEKLKQLEHLSVSHNSLTHLPKVPVSLVSIWAKENPIQVFPSVLLACENLQEIVLSQCQLPSIPTEISNIKSLQKLFLNGNQLKTIPGSISQLHELVELDLRDNPLESLPDDIVDLQVNQLSIDTVRFPISDAIRQFLDEFDASGWRD
jgi:Leucine-rich repeat (LRR) protein